MSAIGNVSSREVNNLINDINNLNTSSSALNSSLSKLSNGDITQSDMLRIQEAFGHRQRLADCFSNIMRTMHEMSMSVVRNMKLG